MFNTNLHKELGMVNGQKCRLVGVLVRSTFMFNYVKGHHPLPPGSVIRIPCAPAGVIVRFPTRHGPDEHVYVTRKTPEEVRNAEARGFKKQKKNNESERHELSVELGFCFTFHKVQGITTSRIVLDILNKPVGRDNSGKLAALCVTPISVKSRDGVLLVPSRTNDNVDAIKKRFLKSISVDKEIGVFLKKCAFPVPVFAPPPEPSF